jgi:hypothetical protein
MKKPAGQPGYHEVTIENCNPNGTFDVRLSSGKKEYNIPPAKLFAPSTDDAGSSSPVKRYVLYG